MSSLLSYKYYDSPEGQDIYKKTFVMSKYAAATGFGLSTFDVLMFSHPKGIVGTVGRFGFIMGPLIGMAAAFTVTTNVVQNFRGKNDKINYAIGGAVAGTIMSAWARSGIIALPAAAVLAAIAVVKKTAVDEGWVFLPDTTLASKSIQSHRHDWTMAKDIPELKTWTTGSE